MSSILDRAIPNGSGGVYIPPERPETLPQPVSIPGCNFDDPAALEAWFGNYGWFEHYRKVVLSNCREMERAKAVAAGIKRTVDQIDDLARNHPNYLHLLTESLPGRILREKNVLESASR